MEKLSRLTILESSFLAGVADVVENYISHLKKCEDYEIHFFAESFRDHFFGIPELSRTQNYLDLTVDVICNGTEMKKAKSKYLFTSEDLERFDRIWNGENCSVADIRSQELIMRTLA